MSGWTASLCCGAAALAVLLPLLWRKPRLLELLIIPVALLIQPMFWRLITIGLQLWLLARPCMGQLGWEQLAHLPLFLYNFPVFTLGLLARRPWVRARHLARAARWMQPIQTMAEALEGSWTLALERITMVGRLEASDLDEAEAALDGPGGAQLDGESLLLLGLIDHLRGQDPTPLWLWGSRLNSHRWDDSTRRESGQLLQARAARLGDWRLFRHVGHISPIGDRFDARDAWLLAEVSLGRAGAREAEAQRPRRVAWATLESARALEALALQDQLPVLHGPLELHRHMLIRPSPPELLVELGRRWEEWLGSAPIQQRLDREPAPLREAVEERLQQRAIASLRLHLAALLAPLPDLPLPWPLERAVAQQQELEMRELEQHIEELRRLRREERLPMATVLRALSRLLMGWDRLCRLGRPMQRHMLAREIDLLVCSFAGLLFQRGQRKFGRWAWAWALQLQAEAGLEERRRHTEAHLRGLG